MIRFIALLVGNSRRLSAGADDAAGRLGEQGFPNPVPGPGSAGGKGEHRAGGVGGELVERVVDRQPTVDGHERGAEIGYWQQTKVRHPDQDDILSTGASAYSVFRSSG